MSTKFAKAAGIAAVLTVLLAGPVLADEMTTTSGSSTLEQLKDQRKTLQDQIKAEREKEKEDRAAASAAKAEALRACVAAAVDKREATIDAGWSAYATATTANLSTRRTALAAAWAMTDRTARRTAIQAAWKAWRDSQRATAKTWHAAKQAAWSQFSKDRRACGSGASSEAPENSSVDASL